MSGCVGALGNAAALSDPPDCALSGSLELWGWPGAACAACTPASTGRAASLGCRLQPRPTRTRPPSHGAGRPAGFAVLCDGPLRPRPHCRRGGRALQGLLDAQTPLPCLRRRRGTRPLCSRRQARRGATASGRRSRIVIEFLGLRRQALPGETSQMLRCRGAMQHHAAGRRLRAEVVCASGGGLPAWRCRGSADAHPPRAATSHAP